MGNFTEGEVIEYDGQERVVAWDRESFLGLREVLYLDDGSNSIDAHNPHIRKTGRMAAVPPLCESAREQYDAYKKRRHEDGFQNECADHARYTREAAERRRHR